jgi:hypothetical protein
MSIAKSEVFTAVLPKFQVLCDVTLSLRQQFTVF